MPLPEPLRCPLLASHETAPPRHPPQIDYDLLEALIHHIDTTMDPGAILVFLPGELGQG